MIVSFYDRKIIDDMHIEIQNMIYRFDGFWWRA